MDKIIYTAMNGAKQSFDQQAVASNNLANVSTPGFRAQLSAMQHVDVQGDGMSTRSLPVASTPGVDLSKGSIEQTSRTLDVVVMGEGYLTVLDADGREAYTRRGDMQIDFNGMLSIGGRPVVGDNGPIILPLDAQISINGSGLISAIEPGQGPETIVEVASLKVVTPPAGALVRGDDGLLRAMEGDQYVALPANEQAQVLSGALEGSNVNPTLAMVEMINTARRYEMQMKVISTADENAQRANSLLSRS